MTREEVLVELIKQKPLARRLRVDEEKVASGPEKFKNNTVYLAHISMGRVGVVIEFVVPNFDALVHGFLEVEQAMKLADWLHMGPPSADVPKKRRVIELVEHNRSDASLIEDGVTLCSASIEYHPGLEKLDSVHDEDVYDGDLVDILNEKMIKDLKVMQHGFTNLETLENVALFLKGWAPSGPGWVGLLAEVEAAISATKGGNE